MFLNIFICNVCNIVYCIFLQEFEIILNKIHGSLGFTLCKEEEGIVGHYVRALVREPAISDGRIQPGDNIVAVSFIIIVFKYLK